MKFSKIESSLESVFSDQALAASNGAIFRPKEAFDLDAAVGSVVEGEEDLERLEWDGTLEILRDKFAVEKIMDFEWDGILGWYSGLYVLSKDHRRTYILLDADDQPVYAIAALEPRNSPDIWTAFFRTLVSKNGEDFGVGLFGSLPTRTINFVPLLISREAVKSAYREWLNWREENGGDEWLSLKEGLGRKVRSKTFAESLRTQFAEIMNSAYPDEHWMANQSDKAPLSEETRRKFINAIGVCLDKRCKESRTIPLQERKHILDLYFAISYKEFNSKKST